MGKLVEFPASPHSHPLNTIPAPIYHQQGDSYARLEVLDDRYHSQGYDAGCLFIIYKGNVWNRWPHAVTVGGEIHVGEVTCTDGLHFDFSAWGGAARRYSAREMCVIGPIIEIWPEGEGGERIIVERPPGDSAQLGWASGLSTS
jgi:hypothetical protein